MKTITKKMLSVLSGAVMMMSSVCLPQFTASAENESETMKPILYSGDGKYDTDLDDCTLLKTCEGTLEESEEGLSVSLTGDDLDGKSYDTIYARIQLNQPLSNHGSSANIIDVQIERTETETVTDSAKCPMCISIDPASHEESTAEIKVMQNMKEGCSVNVKADFYYAENEDPESDPDTWRSVLSGQYYVYFYGYNYLANHMPDDSTLTELGTMTYTYSYSFGRGESQELNISDELLDQKFYSAYLVTAEYEPLPDADTASVLMSNFIEFNFTKTYTTLRDNEDIPIWDSYNTLCSSGMDMQEKANGTMFAATWLYTDRLFGSGGGLRYSCDLSCYPYGHYGGEIPVQKGNVKLTVYGYDPYNLPLLEDMDFLGKTDNPMFGQFHALFNLNTMIPDAYYLFLNVSESEDDENTQECDFAEVSFSVNRKLYGGVNEEREYRGLYSQTETVPLNHQIGVYSLDLSKYKLLPNDEIDIRIKFLRSDGTKIEVNKGTFMLYDYVNPESNQLPPMENLVLLGESETTLTSNNVSDFVDVSSELLYKAPFTEYFAVAEYDGYASEMYFGVEKFRVVRNLLSDDDNNLYTEDETFDTEEYRCDVQNHQAFVSVGRPELGFGRVRVSVAPRRYNQQVTSGTLKIKIYGFNQFMLPDYADMDELKMLGTNYRNQDCTIKIEDAYDFIMLQTRHVNYVADHADITIQVFRDGECKHLQTGTLPLYNGTMILTASTLGANIEIGDEVSFTIDYGEEMNAMMDEACALNGAELHIYGRKQTGVGVQFILGDVSGDSEVDVSDAVLLARFIAEDSEAAISDQGLLAADVNKSGNPDAEDVTLILKYIARIITSFA